MLKCNSLLILLLLVVCVLGVYVCFHYERDESGKYLYVSTLGSVSILPSDYAVDVKGSVGGVALAGSEGSAFFGSFSNAEGKQLYDYVNGLDGYVSDQCGYDIQAANDNNIEVVLVSHDEDYAFFVNVNSDDVNMFVLVLCETKLRRSRE